MGKTYLTKADFLAGIVLKPQDFEVDGLGLVQVRGLSLLELGELRAEYSQNEPLLLLHGAYRGLVNPQLALEDVEALGRGASGPVVSIGTRVFELSGQGKKEEQDPLAGDGSLPSPDPTPTT